MGCLELVKFSRFHYASSCMQWWGRTPPQALRHKGTQALLLFHIAIFITPYCQIRCFNWKGFDIIPASADLTIKSASAHIHGGLNAGRSSISESTPARSPGPPIKATSQEYG